MQQDISLPADRIRVGRDGMVCEVAEWTLWNGEPFETLSIAREGAGFMGVIGDPEHGGGSLCAGTIEEIVGGLHPDVAARYIKLFELVNPTPAELEGLGFKRVEIIPC